MTFTVPVVPVKHAVVPGITDADGTAQMRTVRESENNRYDHAHRGSRCAEKPAEEAP